ncbi:MAG: response regulator, partial [Candidatus Nitrosocosmicus sp.]|nr:response regulator [Candidatus Nitrosocosmicus sp.]
ILKSDSLQHTQIGNTQSLKKELEQELILIAESENELLLLFRTFLTSLGMNTETASNGHEALDRFIESKENGRHYDVIVVDTHLLDPAGLEVAKTIRREKPDQKLVVVTTTPIENLPAECLKTAGIKDIDILTMPFKLSKLGQVLRN